MKLPESVKNNVSFAGALIASISFLIIVFFFIITMIFDMGSSYLGLFMYIVLPVLLILGLILIPVGMLIYRKREKRERRLVLDLNDPRHRNATFVFVLGTIVFLFLSGIGSYEAFHYTESVQFCGTTCHKVMKPEYTAYKNSPHANVTCVECHVGEGADWYVKSKLSGLYQVYSVLFEKYSRPIPTPIHSLRPARETCEHCHWPDQFYSHLLVAEKHYLADDTNTVWNIDLRMKIGASHSALGLTEGIHWHIHQDVKVEYITNKEDRSSIPWVRYINTEKRDTVIYESTINPLDEEDLATRKYPLRTMDCMDCHNRPSHIYNTPQKFVDHAITAGIIPSELPKIKSRAMRVLNKSYPTEDTALMMIREKLSAYYEKKYPEIYHDEAQLVQKAIEGISAEFKKNIFPEMKVSWDAYPDHIGHKEFDGCFRCHSGQHESKDGQVISHDCNLCHTILLQGNDANLEVAEFNGSLDFKHPTDIGEAWKEMLCSECHIALY